MLISFIIFYTYFYGNNFFLKSQKGNEIWTFLKMSKIGGPKSSLKTHKKSRLDHNGHTYFFEMSKFVTIFFR